MQTWKAIAACVALLSAAPAAADGFDPALFEIWAKARAGTGAPVYWYSTGTLRAYPSGELIANVEGYDTARSARPDPGKPLVHQYNRKIYIYRDTTTGEVIRNRNGQAVAPIAYPYQFITYELAGDDVRTWVEQGAGARKQRIGPGDSMQARRLDDTAVFTAPLYLDMPTASGGRYQAFENYDFLIQPGGKTPNQLTWVRYGDAPAWAGGAAGGKAIMHLITSRIDRYEDLPQSMRTYIEADAPLWKTPPRDLADIRRLQAAEPAR